jgi:hypothetical protein
MVIENPRTTTPMMLPKPGKGTPLISQKIANPTIATIDPTLRKIPSEEIHVSGVVL